MTHWDLLYIPNTFSPRWHLYLSQYLSANTARSRSHPTRLNWNNWAFCSILQKTGFCDVQKISRDFAWFDTTVSVIFTKPKVLWRHKTLGFHKTQGFVNFDRNNWAKLWVCAQNYKTQGFVTKLLDIWIIGQFNWNNWPKLWVLLHITNFQGFVASHNLGFSENLSWFCVIYSCSLGNVYKIQVFTKPRVL